MADIIKCWPAQFSRRKTLEVFQHDWGEFYFTIGRGRPKHVVTLDEINPKSPSYAFKGDGVEASKLFYAHRGKLLGHFVIRELRLNNGANIPRLRSITGEVSEWQIRVGRWVAICRGPFVPLRSKRAVYYDSHRGFHYFDLNSYLNSMESQIP